MSNFLMRVSLLLDKIMKETSQNSISWCSVALNSPSNYIYYLVP